MKKKYLSRPLWGIAALTLAIAGNAGVAGAAEDPVSFMYEKPDASNVQSANFYASNPLNPKERIDLKEHAFQTIPAGWLLNGTIQMAPGKVLTSTASSITEDAFETSVTGTGRNARLTMKLKDYNPSGDIFALGWQTDEFNYARYNLCGGKWTDKEPDEPQLFQDPEKFRQIHITPLGTVYKPTNPTREGYTFVGWVGKSLLDRAANEADTPREFTPNNLYSFTEKDPNHTVGYTRHQIVTLSALWAKEPTLEVSDKTIAVGADFDPAAMITQAQDFQNKSLKDKAQVQGDYDPNKPGTYTLIFTVTDKYGGKTTKKAKLIVKPQAPAPKDPEKDRPTEGKNPADSERPTDSGRPQEEAKPSAPQTEERAAVAQEEAKPAEQAKTGQPAASQQQLQPSSGPSARQIQKNHANKQALANPAAKAKPAPALPNTGAAALTIGVIAALLVAGGILLTLHRKNR